MAEQVTAEVILHPAGGSSESATGPADTPLDVSQEQAAWVDQARAALERFGFQVSQITPQHLLIQADKQRFEEVFQTELQPQPSSQQGEMSPFPAPVTYQAVKPLLLPEELKPLVADLFFPPPSGDHPAERLREFIEQRFPGGNVQLEDIEKGAATDPSSSQEEDPDSSVEPR